MKHKKYIRKTLRLGSALFVLLVLAFANVAPVFAASSTLDLSGYDAGNNSNTQIRTGQNNNWVLSYDNLSSGPASAIINNPIPTGSKFVPGSVQTPNGWNVSYSTNNGGTFSNVDPGVTATDLKFENSLVSVPGNGSGKIAAEPLSSTAQSGTGEDGYMPIPYQGRYLGIVHHSSQSGNELVCSTNIPNGCANYPKALNLSGQTDFYTSINPLHYLDQATGRLFFAVQRDIGYGVACWDLNTDQFCVGGGYTELSSSGAKLGAEQPSRLLGVVKTGSCLYAWDVNLVMYSFDPANFSTTCSGNTTQNLASTYSLPVYIPSQHNAITSNYGPVASAEVIDGKIYFPMNYSFKADINLFCGFGSTNYCENTRLVCFDPAIGNGECSGWNTPSLGGANAITQLATGIYQDVNSNNNPCVMFVDALAATTTTNCYLKTDGTSYAIAANLQNNVFSDTVALGNLMGSYEEVTTINSNGDVITVFPFTKFTSAATSAGGGCYNWTTGDECTGWGTTNDGETAWPSVNGGDTRDYGYAVDETGCLLGLGDAGWLWSFSPDDGSVPCRRTVSSVNINPAASYCDGDGNISGWDEVVMSNLNLADFQEILVTVLDSNGDPIIGYENVDIVATAGVLDLSAIPYSGLTQNINIQVLLKALNDDPWANGNTPIASASFLGDDAQICFKTTVEDDCNVPAIVNTANSTITELSDSSVDTKSDSQTMQVVLSNGYVCGASTTNTPGQLANNSLLGKTGAGIKALFAITLIVSLSLILVLNKKSRTIHYKN